MRSFWVLSVYVAVFLQNARPLNCDEVTQNVVEQLKVQSAVKERIDTNGSMKTRSISYAGLIACVASLNPGCFIDQSEDIVLGQYNNFWVEANNEALISGRGSEENPPSKIMDGITKMISELTEILSQGISNLFKDSKDDEKTTELKEDEENDDEEDEMKSRHLEEARLKKKKKKRRAIIKLILVGAVLAAKLSILLKVLSFKLQIKFLLIALAGLLLNAARLFFDLKKGHQPQKVVYYEHAQHQHHYEGGDEEWTGGDHWDRSASDQNTSPQDLAYSKQKPYATIYSRIADKPNYSWKD